MRRVVLSLVIAAVVVGVHAGPAGAGFTSNTFGAVGELSAGGRRAEVTVLLGCTDDGSVRFTVTLTQGDTTGTGHGAGVCTGELEEYTVTVTAGGDTFAAGPATACGDALNREHGGTIATRQWCRQAPVSLR